MCDAHTRCPTNGMPLIFDIDTHSPFNVMMDDLFTTFLKMYTEKKITFIAPFSCIPIQMCDVAHGYTLHCLCLWREKKKSDEKPTFAYIFNRNRSLDLKRVCCYCFNAMEMMF